MSTFKSKILVELTIGYLYSSLKTHLIFLCNSNSYLPYKESNLLFPFYRWEVKAEGEQFTSFFFLSVARSLPCLFQFTFSLPLASLPILILSLLQSATQMEVLNTQCSSG